MYKRKENISRGKSKIREREINPRISNLERGRERASNCSNGRREQGAHGIRTITSRCLERQAGRLLRFVPPPRHLFFLDWRFWWTSLLPQSCRTLGLYKSWCWNRSWISIQRMLLQICKRWELTCYT